MARTIRREPKGNKTIRHDFPSSRARQGERRSDRQSARMALREYAR
jgi:hypothetical protein